MLKPSNCSVKEVWCLVCQRVNRAFFAFSNRSFAWQRSRLRSSGLILVGFRRKQMLASGEMRSGKVSKSLGRKSCLGKSGQLWGGLPLLLTPPLLHQKKEACCRNGEKSTANREHCYCFETHFVSPLMSHLSGRSYKSI